MHNPRKMKKQRNMVQIKKNGTSVKELNKMEIRDLPDRVQNNGHKDVH